MTGTHKILLAIAMVLLMVTTAAAADWYCKVEEGVIVKGPLKLPHSYKNISNFHLIPESELIARGWLPVEYTPPTLGADEIITGFQLTVEAKKVVRTAIVGPKPVDLKRKALVDATTFPELKAALIDILYGE